MIHPSPTMSVSPDIRNSRGRAKRALPPPTMSVGASRGSKLFVAKLEILGEGRIAPPCPCFERFTWY